MKDFSDFDKTGTQTTHHIFLSYFNYTRYVFGNLLPVLGSSVISLDTQLKKSKITCLGVAPEVTSVSQVKFSVPFILKNM